MKQPRALYLLNFISMWENFSYYGMRVLLVLFMLHELQFGEAEAFGLYALYTTLIELAGLAGGLASDKFLGLRRSITLGAWGILGGHLALSLPGQVWSFYLGLGLIVTGTGLFRTNVAALLGEFYTENDPRRQSGYTLYYTGINIGGFLATLICSICGEIFGWHVGFSLAALGMLTGNLALLLGESILEDKGKGGPFSLGKNFAILSAVVACALFLSLAIYAHAFTVFVIPLLLSGCFYLVYQKMRGLTVEQKRGMKKLLVCLVFLILFFLCEEQLGSSLVLFAKKHVDRETSWGVIPATSLITFNPLSILLLGPVYARLMEKASMGSTQKIAFSFFFLGCAFFLLFIGCMTSLDGIVGLEFAILSTVLIALGEIFIGPTVYACAAEVAPKYLEGMTMGMVTLGFALANLLSGVLSQTMAVTTDGPSFELFMDTFKIIGLSMLGMATILFLMNHRLRSFVT